MPGTDFQRRCLWGRGVCRFSPISLLARGERDWGEGQKGKEKTARSKSWGEAPQTPQQKSSSQHPASRTQAQLRCALARGKYPKTDTVAEVNGNEPVAGGAAP